jgi:hypothetical protein
MTFSRLQVKLQLWGDGQQPGYLALLQAGPAQPSCLEEFLTGQGCFVGKYPPGGQLSNAGDINQTIRLAGDELA